MTMPLWACELADAFWDAAGMCEPFPRDLRRPIARALPMTILSLPRLQLVTVERFFREHGLPVPREVGDRSLRACLVAWRGWGYVLLDGSDPEAEQRFSLAHELAHFLRHYWWPRREAERRLGSQALEVLDGHRAATLAEQVHALLAEIPVGVHLHLMDRHAAGGCSEAIAQLEEEADLLAWQLLAPARDVLAGSGTGPLEPLLEGTFGLPASAAARYARLLRPELPRDPLLLRLGLPG